MKKIFLPTFVFATIFSFNGIAQIPTFPLTGLEPAPINNTVNLPAERYVPSTRQWNLVWHDQIIPSFTTPGKVEFAAKNYVGTQKIFDYQAEEFRNFNPNFMVSSYHLAFGLNPANNNDCPQPHGNPGENPIGVVAPEGYVGEYNTHFLPWLNQQGISTGSATFENMFRHYDQNQAAKRVWHHDPYWLMNIESSEWRQYMADICIDWMSGNENESCFMDVAVEPYAYFYHPKSDDASPYNFNWWQAPHHPSTYNGTFNALQDMIPWINSTHLGCFQYLYQRFHAGQEDYLVLPNVDQMVTTIYDPVWMDGDANGEAIDGAMMEGFGNYTGYDMWLTLERGLRHITGRGKILIAQFYDDSPAERLRRTGMYMLIKNENSFINIQNGDVSWYPEYEINLGNQSAVPANLNSLRIAGSNWESLWKRDYQFGVVLCNTSNNNFNYTLPANQNWYRVTTTGGGEVAGSGMPQAQDILYTAVSGQLSIPASGCVILSTQAVNNCSPVITGEQTACVGQTYQYAVPAVPGAVYTWSISAEGTIVSGQGTDTITVIWNGVNTGSVSVQITIP
jgi:hypothetical protein